MATEPTAEPKPEPVPAIGITVAQVLDKFLDWSAKQQAPRTFTDYKKRIQRFLNEMPGVGCLAAGALRPFHLIEWVDKHPTWGDTMRRSAILARGRSPRWIAPQEAVKVLPEPAAWQLDSAAFSG